MWVENRQLVIISFSYGQCHDVKEISTIHIRLLHTSFLPDEKSGQAVFAMTDHFFGGEDGEKEAGGDSAITGN